MKFPLICSMNSSFYFRHMKWKCFRSFIQEGSFSDEVFLFVNALHGLCIHCVQLCVSLIRVFVFIDPAVFPPSLLNALKADVESTDAGGGDPLMCKRRVLLHTMIAGLGKQCHVDQLAHALEVCVWLKISRASLLTTIYVYCTVQNFRLWDRLKEVSYA